MGNHSFTWERFLQLSTPLPLIQEAASPNRHLGPSFKQTRGTRSAFQGDFPLCWCIPRENQLSWQAATQLFLGFFCPRLAITQHWRSKLKSLLSGGYYKPGLWEGANLCLLFNYIPTAYSREKRLFWRRRFCQPTGSRVCFRSEGALNRNVLSAAVGSRSRRSGRTFSFFEKSNICFCSSGMQSARRLQPKAGWRNPTAVYWKVL